jgi:ApbE superfamily uncharacterized protein (UPF0280 family)
MKKLYREAFTLKESQCNVIADKPEGIQAAKNSLRLHRRKLEAYVKTNPTFLHTLKPVAVPREPLVATLMAEAAEKAKVGPMAAVAGVLADLAVKEMLSAGCEMAVVENGGEVSAVSNESIDVAVAAGNEPLSKRFGFRLTEFPIGIATSSGRFSHAFSFGDAEAATVFCRDGGLADAAATAVCNVVKGRNCQAAIQGGITKALSIQGVEGVLIIYKGFTGTAGKIPKIIKVELENKASF